VHGLGGVGVILAEAPIGVVLHVLLAFPSGRLPDRQSRALVVAGYVVTLGLQTPHWMFAGDPSVPSFLRSATHPWLVDLGEAVQSWTGAVVVALAALVLLRRLQRADAQQRRVLTWLSAYGIFTILWLPVTAHLGSFLDWDPIHTFDAQIIVFAGIPFAFTAGILRGRFARTLEVDELGAWLGSMHDARPTLRDALANTLGDPSLALLFRLDDDRYVDDLGRPAHVPAPGNGRAAVGIAVGDEQIGTIVYDALLLGDPALVDAAGRVVALAVDRERLTVALLANREALRASRVRIVEAADTERRRIARDLHDGIQGRLVQLAIEAGMLATDPALREAPTGVRAFGLRSGLDVAITDLRRLVHGVMPALLIERGLFAATEELADRMPVPTAVDMPNDTIRLPAAIESAAYFVVAEALTNAVKHADARHLSVAFMLCGERLRVEVCDDGIGGASLAGGSGLRGIEDRVDALGGHVDIVSVPGAGTCIVAELPCGS
jgi:signal transduction histidine kinase